jgi:homoserine dehydrogenase
MAGLGNVGGAVARLFGRNAVDFEARLGAKVELAWVCDRYPARRLKGLRLPGKPRITRRYEDILADPSVDVVIELIGGIADAKPLVLGALKAGKCVITANKKLLAHEWDAVFREAVRARKSVGFEASVAGAIPILQALSSGLVANEISQLVGILNGTTNFILTEMAHKGIPFERALRRAQACGMAERDPKLDIDGTDTVHKLSILASVISGSWIRPERIYREGIAGVELEDLRFADRELSATIRLLGILRLAWEDPVRLEARVHPALIPLDHPLAAVHGGYNAVLVQASAAKDLMFYGLGAGPEPAASAVLSDLFGACREILGRRPLDVFRPRGRRILLVAPGEVSSRFYLRVKAADRPGVLAQISGALARQEISIARIHQDQRVHDGGVPVMITTHPVAWKRMEKALAALRRLDGVGRRVVCLRQL